MRNNVLLILFCAIIISSCGGEVPVRDKNVAYSISPDRPVVFAVERKFIDDKTAEVITIAANNVQFGVSFTNNNTDLTLVIVGIQYEATNISSSGAGLVKTKGTISPETDSNQLMLIAPGQTALDIYYIPGLNKDVIGFNYNIQLTFVGYWATYTDANSDNIDDNENQELAFRFEKVVSVTTQ